MRPSTILAVLSTALISTVSADVYDICNLSKDTWSRKPSSEMRKSYEDWKKHLPEASPFTSGYEHWEMKREYWYNPHHCWHACDYCVQLAIDANVKAMRCQQNVIFARCWVTFSPRAVDDRID